VTAIAEKNEPSIGNNKPIMMVRTTEPATVVVAMETLWHSEHQSGSSNSSGSYIGMNMTAN